MKIRKWFFILIAVLVPVTLHAAFEHESILKADIAAPILDVATSTADDMIFILTPGAVLIYSTGDRVVLDRIPLKDSFDRIAYQGDDRLVLTAAEPSRINIIRFSRIHAIDLSGRAVKGPRDARVTLVVFDDYQ